LENIQNLNDANSIHFFPSSNSIEKKRTEHNNLKQSTFQIPDGDISPELDNDDVGGDIDYNPSSPELQAEPEVLIKEEERPAEKRRGRKPAAKRSMNETDSEEEEEAPPKKRGRKPKAAPKASTPAAAPPKAKENSG
jgi:hypothetical protein